MKYISEIYGSVLWPKLCGTYERELNSTLHAMREIRPERIINVGAGEGYYAIGLLFTDMTQELIAFEASPDGRKLISKLAEENLINSNRLTVNAACNQENLALSLIPTKRTVIIMDVEGYEDVLLNPDKVKGLADAWLLVEMHDFYHPGLTDAIIDRFRNSHKITRINQEPRRRNEIPVDDFILDILPDYYVMPLLHEFRPVNMHWLWMSPNSACGPIAR